MTSARVFTTLVAAVMATGVATIFVPVLRELVITGWLVTAVLGVAVAVAAHVAAEVRWHRKVDRIINAPAPAPAVATGELVAR